jgi:hypothetical protein
MKCRRLLVPAILLTVGAPAQWLNYPEPGVPRLKDGKVNLLAPVPRTAAGKPDLTGLWLHERQTPEELRRIFGGALADELEASPIGMEIGTAHKYAMNILLDFKPGESPLSPAGEAIMKKHAAERQVTNVCHGEYGWPVAGLLTEPFKILQTPKETVILYEIDSLRRQIYTDGRPFPATFEFPAYLGYSIGRWEGDTLVVDSRGFNDRTPIDAMGHPRSEDMHVTERFHRRDFGHLDVEMTFDDPQLYSRKFTVRVAHELVPDNDIFEMFCQQNEKDRIHMVK